jgi:propionyl-CoA synthetase
VLAGGGDVVTRLPKKCSGKILRGAIKKLADSGLLTIPATIDDPAELDEIGEAMRRKDVGG